MATRRKSNKPGCKPRARKGPISMPSLFSRTVREWYRIKHAYFPDKYPFYEEEQLIALIETAWEKADTNTREYFCRLEKGLSVEQSQNFKAKSDADDVRTPLRMSARARGKKAPSRSRATRAAVTSFPPGAGVHPTAPPASESPDLPSPPYPSSTTSSLSIPLCLVVRSGGSPQHEAGGVPQDHCVDGASFAPHTPSLSTDDFLRYDGALPDPLPSFPFVQNHLYSFPAPLPLDPSPPPGARVHPGARLGPVPESIHGGGGGPHVEEVDSELLHAQNQIRGQMREFYQSVPHSYSFGYAHMPSATVHWPSR